MLIPAYAIKIDLPAGGFLQEKLFDLEATETPYLMKVTYNGISFIAKGAGTFSRKMLAARGLNTITIADANSFTNIDSISFYADVAPTSLKIILFWDTDNTDLDMHIIEPDKTECFYSHKETTLGGRLDVDVTTGYGPEIYTMESPSPGVYEIFIHFYGGQELSEATVIAIMDEGTSKEKRESFQLMLTSPGEKVYVGKVEIK